MVGGKWTTFRAFAEQTGADVLNELGAPRRRDIRALPIGGGKDFPGDREELVSRYVQRFGLDSARATHLVDHYGTKGGAVQAYCAEFADDAPLAVSRAKAYASDSFPRFGIDAIQLHGGIGYTWEYDAPLYLKRAKWARPLFGDADHHFERIARMGGL